MEKDRICEFGFPGPLRDRLVAAVLSGTKTATTSLLAEWEAEGDELPEAGEQETVIDSAGEPVATIEITGCEVRTLSQVDDAVARAKGRTIRRSQAGAPNTSASGVRKCFLSGGTGSARRFPTRRR